MESIELDRPESGGWAGHSGPTWEVDGRCRDAEGRIMEELSPENFGAAHVLGWWVRETSS